MTSNFPLRERSPNAYAAPNAPKPTLSEPRPSVYHETAYENLSSQYQSFLEDLETDRTHFLRALARDQNASTSSDDSSGLAGVNPNASALGDTTQDDLSFGLDGDPIGIGAKFSDMGMGPGLSGLGLRFRTILNASESTTTEDLDSFVDLHNDGTASAPAPWDFPTEILASRRGVVPRADVPLPSSSAFSNLSTHSSNSSGSTGIAVDPAPAPAPLPPNLASFVPSSFLLPGRGVAEAAATVGAVPEGSPPPPLEASPTHRPEWVRAPRSSSGQLGGSTRQLEDLSLDNQALRLQLRDMTREVEKVRDALRASDERGDRFAFLLREREAQLKANEIAYARIMQEAVGAAQRAAVERDIALRSRDEMMRELAGAYGDVEALQSALLDSSSLIQLLRERLNQAANNPSASTNPLGNANAQNGQGALLSLDHAKETVTRAVQEAYRLPEGERKSRIRALQLRWHPDKHQSFLQELAGEITKMINESVAEEEKKLGL